MKKGETHLYSIMYIEVPRRENGTMLYTCHKLILNGRLYTEKGPSRSNPDLDCSSTIGSTTITMSGTLDLNCLVLGHDASHIFPIEIAESKTVGTLRKAIKDEKRPAFDHVPADT